MNRREAMEMIEPLEVTRSELADLMACIADPKLTIDAIHPDSYYLELPVPIRVIRPSIPSDKQVQ